MKMWTPLYITLKIPLSKAPVQYRGRKRPSKLANHECYRFYHHTQGNVVFWERIQNDLGRISIVNANVIQIICPTCNHNQKAGKLIDHLWETSDPKRRRVTNPAIV